MSYRYFYSFFFALNLRSYIVLVAIIVMFSATIERVITMRAHPVLYLTLGSGTKSVNKNRQYVEISVKYSLVVSVQLFLGNENGQTYPMKIIMRLDLKTRSWI